MNWAALDIDGIVVMCGSSPLIDKTTVFPKAEHIITNTPPELISERYFYDGSEFQRIPDKPSEEYVFDRKEKAWYISMDLAAMVVRSKRDVLLAACDWTQTADQPEATKLKWQPYRQELRDITSQAGFPLEIVWPELPQ